MAVIWLSSYPKSGNTWMRFLLANMLRGPISSSGSIQAIVPDMHDPILPAQRAAWQRLPLQVMKTHLVYRDAPPFRGATDGFISIVRNPLDVLASCMNFRLLGRPDQRAEAAADKERSQREYVSTFLREGGDPVWIPEGFGTWPEHVRSWREAAGRHRGLLLRYEDILEEPDRTALELRDWLGLDADDAAVARAVKLSSFDRMKAIEEREIAEGRPGFFTRKQHAAGQRGGVRFMHRGASGGGRATLTEEERERAREVFGGLMLELGYDA